MTTLAVLGVRVVLGAAFSVAVPGPVPAPLTTTSHEASLEVVHPQAAPVFTGSDSRTPVGCGVTDAAPMATEQLAAWLTVKVCPATVSVPVRAVLAVLAATAKVTVPLPVPAAPVATAIHDTLLRAVHEVAELAGVTTMLPVLAPAPTLAEFELSVAEEDAAPWLTLTVTPATVSEPLRAIPVFAAATKLTEPAPAPDAPLATVRNDEPEVAVQAQPAGAVTCNW